VGRRLTPLRQTTPPANSAQSTSSGWKNRRTTRLRSVSSPNASGVLEQLRDVAGEDRDEERSHDRTDAQPLLRQPEERGAQADLDDSGGEHDVVRAHRQGLTRVSGTWAWNGSRATVRWETPAPASMAPGASRAAVRSGEDLGGTRPR
jgi:hypothetical protein